MVYGEPGIDWLDDFEVAGFQPLQDLEGDTGTLMNLFEGFAPLFASATQYLGQGELFVHSMSWG